MRVAVCFRGQLRTFKYTLENLKRYFNTINDGDVEIDYFVHTWDENLYFPTDFHKLSDKENGSYQLADLDKDFLESNLPNLKALEIENHFEYKKNTTTVEHWGALFYSIYKVNLFKLKYENKNNFTYDLVINTRFDLVFPPTVDFPNFNYEDNCAYTFMHLAEMRNEFGYLNFDDMIFYGKSNTVDNIVRIYPNVIKRQLDQKNFDTYWKKRESWDDVPKIYKLGPGSLLSQYLDDRGIKYSDAYPRYFSVAREEVELRKLDGIKDYRTIRQLHLDFYGERKFKVIKDRFAIKPHVMSNSESNNLEHLYYNSISSTASIDNSSLKFTTYGNSEIHLLLGCEDIVEERISDDTINDIRSVNIYPLYIAAFLPWHSSLETIPRYILDACRSNKVWILFEDLLEGSTIPAEEWSSLHLTLSKLGIPPRNIIFTNNNNYVASKYEEWFLSQDIFDERIRVIYVPYDILNINKLIEKGDLDRSISFDKSYEYKKDNLEKCKHFLKLNRTPRNERIASNIFLMEKGILPNTKLSCTQYGWDDNNYNYNYEWVTHENKQKFKKLLPLGVDDRDKQNTGIVGFGDGYFDPNLSFAKTVYFDTFISFVSTPFPHANNEMHLHCSTYNPMYNFQPIVQFGPPESLKTLRKLGFKTFDKWWSEQYDLIRDPSKRLLEILHVIEELNKLTKQELLEMYFDMKEVLEHNHKLLKSYKGFFSIDKGITVENNGTDNT